MIPVTSFAGKTVAVFGLGGSGLASCHALKAGGAEVIAGDDSADNIAKAAQAGFITADLRSVSWSNFAALILTPGAPLTHPAPHWSVLLAREAGVEVIGDIELFCRERHRHAPDAPFVAITGTNGKSTTTALVHHILKTAGVPTLMGGNIGLPILEQEPLPAGGVYVLELSSYQIDLTQTLDCDVAVLLNITPDHLDRYDGFEGYAASKARLFAMQSAEHDVVIGVGDQASDRIAESLSARNEHVVVVGRDPVASAADWPSLQGPHNAQNAVAAMIVGAKLNVAVDAIEAALCTFTGLPHRMERVAIRNGVTFVDDSKATNPESAAPALGAFERIHWIVGGKRKGNDLDACAPYFDRVVAAYTIGEAAQLFADILTPKVPHVEQAGDLAAAVRHAAAAARPGETVLLSPACASFDQFRDYEARGAAFRAAVEALD